MGFKKNSLNTKEPERDFSLAYELRSCSRLIKSGESIFCSFNFQLSHVKEPQILLQTTAPTTGRPLDTAH